MRMPSFAHLWSSSLLSLGLVVGACSSPSSEGIGAADTAHTPDLSGGGGDTPLPTEDTAAPSDTSEASDTAAPSDTGEASDTAAPSDTGEASDTAAPSDTGEASDTAAPSDTGEASDTAAPSDTADTSETPPGEVGTCSGYATRYWDCCKPHCGWAANASGLTPVQGCGMDGASLVDANTSSACDGGNSFTCFSMAPWAVSQQLSYGFAAVPASGDICGRCYRIDFEGTGRYDSNDPGSRQLVGKTMVVQATNIGYDVGGGQFDLLIPGGGVGAFNACSRQWGVSNEDLGAQYGGFLTACRASNPTHEGFKTCVRQRCQSVFASPHLSHLKAGCEWFVDWYQAADNPNLRYREVECPQALIDLSQVDRRSRNDIHTGCGTGGQGPATCECDCGWANNGASCGQNDGSCCWRVCCGG